MCKGDSLDCINIYCSPVRYKWFFPFHPSQCTYHSKLAFQCLNLKEDDMKCLSRSLIICSTEGGLDMFFEKEPHHPKQLFGEWEIILAAITGR